MKQQIGVQSIESIGELESINASISVKNSSKFFDMVFTSYRDPIGSLIRELTSNCFDSHIEAKIDDAVRIKLGRDEEEPYISFTDVGVGLSPERIEKVYMIAGESTKENSDDFIGYWGIGSKSPLAYTDSFQIKTRFDGIEYYYIYYRGDETPRIEKVYEIPTVERNGTEIKVIIKNSDYSAFIKGLKTQLQYFDNVYYEDDIIDNKYQIYEYENFKVATNTYLNELHLCIGKVIYPINWNALGIRFITCPIGLKFKIGELTILPTREDIKYTKENITKILDKIELAKKEIRELWEIDNIEVDDLFLYYKVNKEKFIIDKRVEIYIGEMVKNLPNPIFSPFRNLPITLPDNPFFFLRTDRIIERDRIRLENWHLFGRNSEDWIFKINPTTIVNSKKNKYINSLNKRVYLLSTKYISAKTYLEYLGMNWFSYTAKRSKLNINKLNKSETKKIVDYSKFNKSKLIKLYKKEIINQLKRKFNIKSYEDLVISKDWLKSLKNTRAKPLTTRFPVYSYLESNKNYHLETNTKFRTLVIYGYKEDSEKLEKIADLLKYVTIGKQNKKTVEILELSKVHTEKLKKMGNQVFHIDEFNNQNSYKLLRKVITRLAVKDFFNKIGITYSNWQDESKLKSFSILNSDISRDFVTLYKYVYDSKRVPEEIEEELRVLGKTLNLYDTTILEIIKRIEKYIEDVELIKYVEVKRETIPHLIKYLKQNKKKVNLEYYTNSNEKPPEIIELEKALEEEPF